MWLVGMMPFGLVGLLAGQGLQDYLPGIVCLEAVSWIRRVG